MTAKPQPGLSKRTAGEIGPTGEQLGNSPQAFTHQRGTDRSVTVSLSRMPASSSQRSASKASWATSLSLV